MKRTRARLLTSLCFPILPLDQEAEMKAKEEGTLVTDEEVGAPVVVKEGDDAENITRLPVPEMRPTKEAPLKKTWALRSKGPVPEVDWIPPPERAKLKVKKKVAFAPDTLSAVTELPPK